MSVPRVLQVTDHLRSGGAERLVAALVAELAARGLATSVVCTATGEQDGAELRRIVRAAAREHVVLGRRRLADPRLTVGLVRAGRRHRVDLVHSHPGTANVHAAAAARVLGVPHVVTLHTMPGPLIEDSAARDRTDAWAARRCAALVAPSPTVGRAWAARWGVAPSRLRTVANAAFAAPAPRRAAVPAAVGAAGSAPSGRTVLAVARLQPAKGLDVLVDAAARLLPDRPDVRVVIAGAGPEQDALRARIAAAGLSGRVELLGPRSDVPALLAAADAFVLPSRHEGVPLSLLEAMAAGAPCVATAVGGVPDVAADGREALLVPPGDPAALAGALARVLDEPALAAGLGARAAETAAREHTMVTAARRYGALYREVLAGADA